MKKQSKSARSKQKHYLIILSRNRANLLEALLKSLKNEISSDIEVFISDNSTNEYNRELVKSVASNYGIGIKINKNLTVAQHYHRILNNLKDAYATIIHDDDLILPGFIQEVRAQIKQTPEVAAIAVNGYAFTERITKGNSRNVNDQTKFFWSLNKLLKIDNESELICNWISPICLGIAPFGSYTFNTSYYKETYIYLYSRCGLLFDTVLVALFAESERILWIDKPLINIRQHADSLSSSSKFRDSESVYVLFKQRYSNNKIVTRTCDYFIASRRLTNSGSNNSLLSYFDWLKSIILFVTIKPVTLIIIPLKLLARNKLFKDFLKSIKRIYLKYK